MRSSRGSLAWTATGRFERAAFKADFGDEATVDREERGCLRRLEGFECGEVWAGTACTDAGPGGRKEA